MRKQHDETHNIADSLIGLAIVLIILFWTVWGSLFIHAVWRKSHPIHSTVTAE